jgi:hypothetical protein
MFQNTVRDRFNSLQNLSADDVLGVLGLSRKRSSYEDIAPSLAIFAAGAFVGAAAALLLAPKAGPQLRRELTEGARDLSQRLTNSASSVVADVREALPFGENDKQRTEAAGANSNHTARRA